MDADRLEAYRTRLRADPAGALKDCGVPPAYLSARMADFDGKPVPPMERPHLLAEYGLFITGDAGTGKTHLATAGLAELLPGLVTADKFGIPHGPDALWTAAPQVLQELRATFNGRGESEIDVTKRYTRPALLVLDDLGAEQATDWTGQALYLLLSTRVNHLRPTIITSNLSLQALDARDPRLASRLGGMAYQRLTGEDRRVVRAGELGGRAP